jgi:DivIVA domain-containing protein
VFEITGTGCPHDRFDRRILGHRLERHSGVARVTAVLDAAQLRAAAAALTHTKFREGYDVIEVDALLARAAVALDEQQRAAPLSLTSEVVLNVKFTATKFRDGYSQDEVDDLLDQVISSLKTASPAFQNPTTVLDSAPPRDAGSAHPRALRAAVRTAVALCALGLVFTATAVVTYPGDAGVHHLALQLRDHGAPATVTHVEVHPNSKNSGSVTVAFLANGQLTAANLAGADAGSASEAPSDYRVEYLPEDPTQVMSEGDIPYYADDALSDSRSVMLVGLAPTVLLAALWLARRRPPWWLWL